MCRWTSWVSTGIFLMCVSLAGCHGGERPDGNEFQVHFHHEGLDGHEVIRLYQSSGDIFAATSKGLYKRTLTGEWQSAGLDQLHVFDVALLSDTHWLASTRDEAEGGWIDKVVETSDSGRTWQMIEHNFGGDEAETVFGLAYDRENSALYATGREALAVSYDFGHDWELLAGTWGGFAQPKQIVRQNPATNEIWYGGQNAIEQMELKRYSLDSGLEQRFADLLPSPSVIYGIQFDPVNEHGIYVSGEGGVLKTDDNGEHWAALMADVDHRFYFDIAIDPYDPQTLFTAGWTKNWETPQPLILEISRDGGATWRSHHHPSDELFGGMRSILATKELGETVLYIGLYGGGVMRAAFTGLR